MTGQSSGLTAAQRRSASRIAALTVVNAMVFQEVLATHDGRVEALHRTLEAPDPISAFCDHWQFILNKINYVPIFKVAREVLLAVASGPDVENAVRSLANRALDIVGQRAALRHDLMGRVYHRLLTEAKYLGTYYTSVPAATLLLKVALDPERWAVDWSDLEALSDELRIADLACGTGTLLMAAAESVTDNYVRTCAEKGIRPDIGRLHKVLMEDVVYGYDVLPSALHLTASTLAIRAPDIAFQQMQLYSLPLGGPHRRLGSIEFLRGREVSITVDLFGDAAAHSRVTGMGDAPQPVASLPDLDLCVMNPPFTRSTGKNLLFGSAPETERKAMQRELQRLLRSPGVHASSTAGLGSVFVAAGDKFLKEGGRMALVLPRALLSGVAWGETRKLLAMRYQLEYLIVSHEPGRWNFSENTNLSEVLVVAQKMYAVQEGKAQARDVVCLNLWKNPENMFQGYAVAHALTSGSPPDVEHGQGALEVKVGDVKFAEAVSVPWRSLRQGLWMLPCAFAQSELVRAAHHLIQGRLYLPGVWAKRYIRFCALGQLGKLGPQRRDIHDGFERTGAATPYPAFWGHEAWAVTTLAQTPNAYLSPLPGPKQEKGGQRPLRKVQDLWPRAGHVLIGERLRLNTQRLAAVRVGEKVLSNVWWPFASHQASEGLEKALVLWLNSTLGLLILLAHREETEGAWIHFKKQVLEEVAVLDVLALTERQRRALVEGYERLSGKTVLPFPQMDDDPVRREIDELIRKTLRLPDFGVLRQMLAREPVVCLRPLG